MRRAGRNSPIQCASCGPSFRKGVRSARRNLESRAGAQPDLATADNEKKRAREDFGRAHLLRMDVHRLERTWRIVLLHPEQLASAVLRGDQEGLPLP